MISLYGASNELPQGAELSALWDRFTVRVAAGYVSKAAFPRLIQMAAERPSSEMLRVAHMITIRMSKKRAFSSWHADCISCTLMMRVRIV